MLKLYPFSKLPHLSFPASRSNQEALGCRAELEQKQRGHLAMQERIFKTNKQQEKNREKKVELGEVIKHFPSNLTFGICSGVC